MTSGGYREGERFFSWILKAAVRAMEQSCADDWSVARGRGRVRRAPASACCNWAASEGSPHIERRYRDGLRKHLCRARHPRPHRSRYRMYSQAGVATRWTTPLGVTVEFKDDETQIRTSMTSPFPSNGSTTQALLPMLRDTKLRP